MTTRLKNLHLTSVDLVKAGANQEADICLFKSAPDEAGEPSEEETGIIKQFIAWLRKSAAERENEPEEDEEHESFDEVREEREDKEANYILGIYLGALEDSILSIERDDELDGDRKKELILESLDEFTDAMVELVPDLAEIELEEETMKKSSDIDEIEEVTKYNHNHGTERLHTKVAKAVRP